MSLADPIADRGTGIEPAVRSPIGSLRRWLATSATRDSALALPFVAFLVFQIHAHAMWRDELHPWGLVLASPSLGALFHHMHYEGHPGLWHLGLWLLSFVVRSPTTVQVVQGVVAIAIIGLIALASPFNRLEKLLLLSSYFIVFEYAVPSRNYGIGVLIVLAYARLRSRHPERAKTLALLLGLLANANVFVLILSGGLVLEYLAAASLKRTADWRRLARDLAPAAAIYGALLALAVATLWPAPDISWRTTGSPQLDRVTLPHFTNVLIDFLSALLPLSQQSFWAPPSMIDPVTLNAERLAIGLASPLLLVGFTRMFARRKTLLLVPGVALVGAVLFSLVVYDCYPRHWGVVFVAFVAAYWIDRAEAGRPSPFGIGLLALNAIAAIAFTIGHWGIPFSNAPATAAWVGATLPPDVFLVGTPDTNAAPVAELLGREEYFLDCRCADSFLYFQRRRDDFTLDDVPPRLAEAVAIAGARPVIFLSGRPLDDHQKQGLVDAGLTLAPLARFDGALVENFDVFAVTKRDP